MLANRVFEVISERGPLTGSELRSALECDPFELWRICRSGSEYEYKTIGRRYLRLDERLPGLARLSPSILREFLTYCVVSLEGQSEAATRKARAMRERTAEISDMKANVARSMVATVMASVAERCGHAARTAFILAGDVVFGMAHESPRPERSTGKMVKGSDIDIIALTEDSASDEYLRCLEEAMSREKYLLLVNPRMNQEIDFIVKRFARAREQIAFDSFKRMVACKIMREGILIDGDERLFAEMRTLLDRSGVNERLREMEARAQVEREAAIESLLSMEFLGDRDGIRDLFYSSEESEEFE